MGNFGYEMEFMCRKCKRAQHVSSEEGRNSGSSKYARHDCKKCGYPNVFSIEELENLGISDERVISMEKHWETDNEPEFDAVNKPQGYNSYDLETINAIRGQSTDEEFQGYLKGNVMKYVARYNFKNGVEDLEKLITYAEFLRDHVKGEWKK